MDDAFFVEIQLFKLEAGMEVRTPFHMRSDTLINYMNKVYKIFIMESLKECAPAAPQIKDAMEGPVGPMEIEANRCIIDITNYPARLAHGLYKLVFSFSGPNVETKIIYKLKIFKA